MFYDLSRGIVNLKIEHLYYLREISNCRSISAAAKRLFIGQTTLSAIVKSMEEDLGGPLYNRTPGGVELTKEGEFFQQFADEILAKYDAMLDLFKSASSMQKSISSATPPPAATFPFIFPSFWPLPQTRFP